MNNFNQQSYFAPVNGIRSTNNIIWVQGIEGAKAWQLAPNSMAIFLDSENEGKMYIKVTDNIGIDGGNNYTNKMMMDNIDGRATRMSNPGLPMR